MSSSESRMAEDEVIRSMAFSQRRGVVGCNTTEERDVVRHNGGCRAIGGRCESQWVDGLFS